MSSCMLSVTGVYSAIQLLRRGVSRCWGTGICVPTLRQGSRSKKCTETVLQASLPACEARGAHPAELHLPAALLCRAGRRKLGPGRAGRLVARLVPGLWEGWGLHCRGHRFHQRPRRVLGRVLGHAGGRCRRSATSLLASRGKAESAARLQLTAQAARAVRCPAPRWWQITGAAEADLWLLQAALRATRGAQMGVPPVSRERQQVEHSSCAALEHSARWCSAGTGRAPQAAPLCSLQTLQEEKSRQG